MNQIERANLVNNIAEAMRGISGNNKETIINRQLCHFFQSDENLRKGVAAGLGVDLNLSGAKLQQKIKKL